MFFLQKFSSCLSESFQIKVTSLETQNFCGKKIMQKLQITFSFHRSEVYIKHLTLAEFYDHNSCVFSSINLWKIFLNKTKNIFTENQIRSNNTPWNTNFIIVIFSYCLTAVNVFQTLHVLLNNILDGLSGSWLPLKQTCLWNGLQLCFVLGAFHRSYT